ncbi:hypothetical protein DER44DRAFT_742780 [Fusarium oxysporum]|nr:hypothetical protein DER44DRAFT_742780 [Fusarium oxysporum]
MGVEVDLETWGKDSALGFGALRCFERGRYSSMILGKEAPEATSVMQGPQCTTVATSFERIEPTTTAKIVDDLSKQEPIDLTMQTPWKTCFPIPCQKYPSAQNICPASASCADFAMDLGGLHAEPFGDFQMALVFPVDCDTAQFCRIGTPRSVHFEASTISSWSSWYFWGWPDFLYNRLVSFLQDVFGDVGGLAVVDRNG